MILFIFAFAVTTENTMTNDITKPKEEKILVERKCNICGKKAKMGRFERYCDVHCRNKATRLDSENHSVKFR